MSVEEKRRKVRNEVLRLKDILDDFLGKGDVGRQYYDQAFKRSAHFLPNAEDQKAPSPTL